MSIGRFGAALVWAALATAACGSHGAANPSVSETASSATVAPPTLDRSSSAADAVAWARSRWAETATATYVYSTNERCECDGTRLTTRVENGALVGDAGWTVEELFDRIDSSVAAGVENEVTFDPDSGRPVTIKLDINALERGETGGDTNGGFHLEIADFAATEVNEPRARWIARRPAIYTMTYRCTCSPLETTVVVDGDSVMAASTPAGPVAAVDALTVEILFERIDDAIAKDAVVEETTYDTGLGYPDDISVRHPAGLTIESKDDTWGIEVLSLVTGVQEPIETIVGPLWKLESLRVGGVDVDLTALPTPVTVEVAATGVLGVDGPCNTIGGPYRLVAATIVGIDLLTTTRACAGDGSEVERRLLELFNGPSTVSVENGTLLVTLPSGPTSARFAR